MVAAGPSCAWRNEASALLCIGGALPCSASSLQCPLRQRSEMVGHGGLPSSDSNPAGSPGTPSIGDISEAWKSGTKEGCIAYANLFNPWASCTRGAKPLPRMTLHASAAALGEAAC
eukprot:757419-Pleurochrysis_carterae.AAC.1